MDYNCPTEDSVLFLKILNRLLSLKLEFNLVEIGSALNDFGRI